MKTSKYLAVIMAMGAIWVLLDVQSLAQSLKIEITPRIFDRINHPQLAQSLEKTATNLNVNKDLMLQDITITQNSTDKSLLTVKGFINNRSDQSHYVYYIVAKFVSNDIAIKQTIIPVNVDLEPGESKPFTHEISTGNKNVIAPETVKPLVVKYEYR